MVVLEDAELWVILGLPGKLICSAPGGAGAGHGGLLLLWDPQPGAAGLLQLSASPSTMTDLALSHVCTDPGCIPCQWKC